MHLYVSYQQETGYDFLSNMQVFDPKDRASIKFGLLRVFNFSNDLINKKIAEQVHCIGCVRGSGIVGLT